jgi:hypothetical protein
MTSEADDDFPPDYGDRIERVCTRAADELRSCRDDVLAQLKACCHYFESGEHDGISHGELVDFLGADGRVFERAGYSDAEARRVMGLLRLITYDKDGRPHAPEALPPSAPPAPEQQRLIWAMTLVSPNNTHALDAAMTFLFHIDDHWRRASDVER